MERSECTQTCIVQSGQAHSCVTERAGKNNHTFNKTHCGMLAFHTLSGQASEVSVCVSERDGGGVSTYSISSPRPRSLMCEMSPAEMSDDEKSNTATHLSISHTRRDRMTSCSGGSRSTTLQHTHRHTFAEMSVGSNPLRLFHCVCEV